MRPDPHAVIRECLAGHVPNAGELATSIHAALKSKFTLVRRKGKRGRPQGKPVKPALEEAAKEFAELRAIKALELGRPLLRREDKALRAEYAVELNRRREAMGLQKIGPSAIERALIGNYSGIHNGRREAKELHK